MQRGVRRWSWETRVRSGDRAKRRTAGKVTIDSGEAARPRDWESSVSQRSGPKSETKTSREAASRRDAVGSATCSSRCRISANRCYACLGHGQYRRLLMQSWWFVRISSWRRAFVIDVEYLDVDADSDGSERQGL